MLAQTVAFQVKAYEYRALMASIVKQPPTPKSQPRADLMITWVVDHAKEPLAPHRRDRQEVRRGRAAAQGGHRPPSQDPLGRPGAGRPQPRLLGPVQRVAPQSRSITNACSSCPSIDRVCSRSSSEPPKGAPGRSRGGVEPPGPRCRPSPPSDQPAGRDLAAAGSRPAGAGESIRCVVRWCPTGGLTPPGYVRSPPDGGSITGRLTPRVPGG